MTPIGPRNFFPSYVFFLLLFVERSDLLPSVAIDKTWKKLISCFIGVVFSVTLVCFLGMFARIHSVTLERSSHTREQINCGNNTIEILVNPHQHLLWNSTPIENTNLAERLKLFYDFPSDIVLVPVKQYSN